MSAQSRLVTVQDLNTFAELGSGTGRDIDVRSPDGRYIATVMRRGDVTRNEQVYTLLVFRADSLLTAPRPDTILIFASTSNNPAIAQLKWLADNRTLAFLGQRPASTPGESNESTRALPQVYVVDIRTHRWIQRTHHPAAITGFDIASTGDPILYAVAPSRDTSQYPVRRRHGMFIHPSQFVGDLVAGIWAEGAAPLSPLFLQRRGAATPIPVRSPGPAYRECWDQWMSLAPTGTTALLACMPRATPPDWSHYTDHNVQNMIRQLGVFPQYLVLDLSQGTITPLMNAPSVYPNVTERISWSPDGRSVALGNTYLPLDVPDSAERAWRASHRAVAEVNVRSHAVSVVTCQDSLDVVQWDATTNVVTLMPGLWGLHATGASSVAYRKTADGWSPMTDRRKPSGSPELTIDQDMNGPPAVVAIVPQTGERRLVFNPDPELVKRFRFGHEIVAHWETARGAHWAGGLYLPPDYDPHRRYPLVIQTHGFDSTLFLPAGFGVTAYAAQPLASAGIMVLQIGESREHIPTVTAREAPAMEEGIEAAIDHLDSLGFIDPMRVGLSGFSRTCYYAEYLLTHSTHPIAAAAIADGVDMGYLQYMLFEHGPVHDEVQLEADSIYGGPPWGVTLARWKDAPGFNLDHVHAPVLVEAIGPLSLLEEWEIYAGLILQNKPAEMLYLPGGVHILQKPWERIVSQQGVVDWFRFWLQSYEDPDPAKAPQYARWRRLRVVRDSTEVKTTSAAKPAEGH